MIATAGHQLNPTAEEYIPLQPHPHLLHPMNSSPTLPWLHLPPPPTFLHPKLPPPSPSPSPLILIRRPVQVIWAPVPYAYPSPGSGAFFPSSAKPAKPSPPPKQVSVVTTKKRLPPRQRRPTPRHLGRVWRKRNSGAGAGEAPVKSVEYPFGDSTTLMIRNIPNRLRQRELVRLLAEHCAEMNKDGEVTSAFDLVYLPVDFSRRGNKGYAFVNFTSTAGAAGLYRAWTGLEWERFGYQTKKIRVITTAKLQGDKMKTHLERSQFECDTDEYLPVVLVPACDGFNLSDVEGCIVGSRFQIEGA